MARPRTRKSDNGVAPPPSPAAEAPRAPKAPRASTLDEVLEQVRKIAAAEREVRNLQGSLKSLRDGLQGLVDRMSSEDQEIYRSILSVEPVKAAENEPAAAEQFDSADVDVS